MFVVSMTGGRMPAALFLVVVCLLASETTWGSVLSRGTSGSQEQSRWDDGEVALLDISRDLTRREVTSTLDPYPDAPTRFASLSRACTKAEVDFVQGNYVTGRVDARGNRVVLYQDTTSPGDTLSDVLLAIVPAGEEKPIRCRVIDTEEVEVSMITGLELCQTGMFEWTVVAGGVSFGPASGSLGAPTVIPDPEQGLEAPFDAVGGDRRITVRVQLDELIRLARQPVVTIPLVDLKGDTSRQVVIDRDPGQYLGHPTTCLLEDGKTMLCVYPKGHGRGGIVYKRSTDGGLTWSDRIPVPESWATSKEVPTLFRVTGPDGKRRVIMFSGLYPARLAVSEDDGETWSELEKAGDWGGIVVMGCFEPLRTGPGHYLAMFHDDGRFFAEGGKRGNPAVFRLLQTLSTDGGLTWSFPTEVHRSSKFHICEPGVVRSPDGRQLAVLLRENSRRHHSRIMFSNDEGKTWSFPRALPNTLHGDRHTAQYSPDGRIFMSFRSRVPKGTPNATEGDWVGWVGTWDDLVHGRPGQYNVRLEDNTKGADCAYPGVEILPDGTYVTTTYGHWAEGEQPYILSVRFTLDELDRLAGRRN